MATVSSGTITALSPGVTTITAKIIGPLSYTDSFELTVKRSEDPFHPTNIEYMQIKKYNEDQSCIYRESETTTIVLKSALLNYEYFECYTSSRDSAVFRVDNNLDVYKRQGEGRVRTSLLYGCPSWSAPVFHMARRQYPPTSSGCMACPAAAFSASDRTETCLLYTSRCV